MSTKPFTIKLDETELARVQKLQERLQSRAAKYTRVTQRTTILEALDALESHLNDLDRPRKRRVGE